MSEHPRPAPEQPTAPLSSSDRGNQDREAQDGRFQGGESQGGEFPAWGTGDPHPYGEGHPPYGGGWSTSGYGLVGTPEARTQALTALILGAVGLVTGFGVILGPVGLSQARKAAAGGADATAGRVLSIVATVVGALIALFFLVFVVFWGLAMSAAFSDRPLS